MYRATQTAGKFESRRHPEHATKRTYVHADAARLTPVDGETLSRRRERRLAQVRRMIDEAPAIVAQRELEVARLEAERARRGLR